MTALRLAQIRGRHLRERLARHRLVFVQLGSVFDPLRAGILEELGGRQLNAIEFAGSSLMPGDHVLLGVEDFVKASRGNPTMGQLRSQIMRTLDSGYTVCLVSRSPRMAFPPVPGSSLLEDVAPYLVPLLRRDECIEERRGDPAALLPAIGLDAKSELEPLYQRTLEELGTELLASLDRTLFEARIREDGGLSLMRPLELEALRGAGIVTAVESVYTFAVRRRVGELANALDEVISNLVDPQSEITHVASDLWSLERILRSKVRRAAISGCGRSWPAQVLTGLRPSPTSHVRTPLEQNLTRS